MKINTKGIKAFLQDSKAISPAIATLILIVIAVVAAAGVGILVQSSQKNAEAQSSNKDLSVSGDFVIKGSTTVLPVSQNEIQAFSKIYPSVTITLGGGGSGYGKAAVYNKLIDVGASSSIWDPAGGSDSSTGTTLNYPSRTEAVIQGTGANAFVYETKIGTGLIVVAGNIAGATSINIVPGTINDSTNESLSAGGVLNLTYGELKQGYVTGTIPKGNVSGLTADITTVQRSDDSGTEDVFSDYMGLRDSATTQFQSSVKAIGQSGNQGIRDYIATTKNTIGFVDIGFAAGGINGNAAVIPAAQNGTVASKLNKGVGGTYDASSKSVSGNKGLARDLYYYSQPGVPAGAVKAYLDFVLSPDGQKIVESSGYYQN